MKSFFHTFATVEDLVLFIKRAELCDYEVDVRYNHILVDGKSLIGVMNIGIGKSVEIICHSENASAEQLFTGRTVSVAV